MLPIHRIAWHELRTPAWRAAARRPEPMAMEGAEQVDAYVDAYAWGGPASAVQLHHLDELSQRIRPGDLVLDLACGPGPLLLELAALYPACRFVGVDMSRPMLARLEAAAAGAGLANVSTICADIRGAPPLERRPDVVISTSSLHHLPALDDVAAVFRTIAALLRRDGAFYLFDFGALRSPAARRLAVAEVERSAPRLTAIDYALSLDAAFAVDEVFALADRLLPRPLVLHRSRLADFCWFAQSPPRCAPAPAVRQAIAARARRCSLGHRLDRLMLRLLRRSWHLEAPTDPPALGAPAGAR